MSQYDQKTGVFAVNPDSLWAPGRRWMRFCDAVGPTGLKLTEQLRISAVQSPAVNQNQLWPVTQILTFCS